MKTFKHYGPVWILLLITVLSLSGDQKPPRPPMRLTLRAQITYQDQTFTYEDPHKLPSVLTWLRLLRPKSPVKTIPETDPPITITLYHSDHTQTTYRLYALGYLTTDGITFRPVNPTYARQIFNLLHLLPPDS